MFGGTQRGYTSIVGKLVVRPVRVMLVFALVVLLSVGMFLTLPRSFLPDEDQGYFIVVAQLPDGASKQRTDAVLERIEVLEDQLRVRRDHDRRREDPTAGHGHPELLLLLVGARQRGDADVA